MQITNAYRNNINITVRGVTAPIEEAATALSARSTPQVNVVVSDAPVNQLPANQLPAEDPAAALKQEINILLLQFSEWMRVSSESKRMELLYNILLKQNHETSDLFGKILDIARRIMSGDKVSLEEMRFLAEQNPQLFYAVIVMKDEATDVEGQERRRKRERRNKDRRLEPRRRDQNLRSYNSTTARVIERMNYSVPSDLAKSINTLLVNKSLKKSYENSGKNKKLSISINTVITNPLDVAN